MKLAFHLAYKNLTGAGLRTWLNVGVLAFAFLMIIFFNSLLQGWNEQARRDSIAWEFGHGQLRHTDYDPYDPFSIADSHGIPPSAAATDGAEILLRQASIYPDGRMISLLLTGIEPEQTVLQIPTASLRSTTAEIPVVIGESTAKSAKLKVGDTVLLRWRDKNGTFDAADVVINEVFQTDVPTADKGKMYISLPRLREMTGLAQEVTFVTVNADYTDTAAEGWVFKSQEDLLRNITEIIETKKASSSILYILLLFIALLAVFDTQVLSVFRRQREIGSYIALGMTRSQVVRLFTVEGSMYSIFAVVIGLLIGIPLFAYLSSNGISLPQANAQDMGVAIADVIYPSVGFKLLLGTLLLVVLSATAVSFMPARKIAKMKPTDALKGKIQ